TDKDEILFAERRSRDGFVNMAHIGAASGDCRRSVLAPRPFIKRNGRRGRLEWRSRRATEQRQKQDSNRTHSTASAPQPCVCDRTCLAADFSAEAAVRGVAERDAEGVGGVGADLAGGGQETADHEGDLGLVGGAGADNGF